MKPCDVDNLSMRQKDGEGKLREATGMCIGVEMRKEAYLIACGPALPLPCPSVTGGILALTFALLPPGKDS